MWSKRSNLRSDKDDQKFQETYAETQDSIEESNSQEKIGWNQKKAVDYLKTDGYINNQQSKYSSENRKIESPVVSKSRFSSLFAFRPVWNSSFNQDSQNTIHSNEEETDEKNATQKDEIIVLSPVRAEEEEYGKIDKMEEEKEQEIFGTFTEVTSSNERYKTRPSVNLSKKKIIYSQSFSDDSDSSGYIPDEKVNETESIVSQDFSDDEIFFSPAEVKEKSSYSSYDEDFNKFFTDSRKRKSEYVTPKKRKAQKIESSKITEVEEDIEDFSSDDDDESFRPSLSIAPSQQSQQSQVYLTPTLTQIKNKNTTPKSMEKKRTPKRVGSTLRINYTNKMEEEIEEADDEIELESPQTEQHDLRNPNRWLDRMQVTKKNQTATFNLFNDILKKPKLGYLGSKLQRSLSRIQIEGNSNKSKESNIDKNVMYDTQDQSEPYLDLIIISNVKTISSYFGVVCQNQNDENEFFNVLFWHLNGLEIGKTIRIYKPISIYYISAMKTILCTYFFEVGDSKMNKKEINESVKLFNKMKKLKIQQAPRTPTKSKKKIVIKTPQKHYIHTEVIQEKDFVDVLENISLIPLCDDLCSSIRISGVIQRVIQVEEPDRESEDDRHIDFIKYNHIIILQEIETKKICFLKIPHGEFEYWNAVFKAEGRLFEFRAIRLVKKNLITSKRIKSMIQPFTKDLVFFEFHVQGDSTCKIAESDTQLTQSEYINNPIDSMYVSFLELNVDEIKSTKELRFDLKGSISHVKISTESNDPLCILYVQDKESIQSKTYIRIHVDRIVFCLRILEILKKKKQIQFRNLYKTSNSDFIEFDEFTVISPLRESNLKCKFSELENLKLYEIGILNRQITSVVQDKMIPYSHVCFQCSNELMSSNFCEFCLTNTRTKRVLNFNCLTNKSEIVHMNGSIVKKLFPKEFKKFTGNESFEDLQKLFFGKHSILARIDEIKDDIFYFTPIVDEFNLNLNQFQTLLDE